MSQRHLSSVSLYEQCMLAVVALALVAMLSLPAMRSVSESFGWVPFWLLTLPLTAWAAARALRHHGQRDAALTMATMHRIAAVRPHTGAVGQQALRRAA
jgi:hypothetical protein